MLIQLLGIVSVGLLVVLASTLTWLVLKATMGIRVGAEEEKLGLDLGEHGMEAYPGLGQAQSESMEIS